MPRLAHSEAAALAEATGPPALGTAADEEAAFERCVRASSSTPQRQKGGTVRSDDGDGALRQCEVPVRVACPDSMLAAELDKISLFYLGKANELASLFAREHEPSVKAAVRTCGRLPPKQRRR